MSDFGQLLKQYRERRNLSQSSLARSAMFNHSYLSRLESGERQPTRDAVERLAKALDVPGDDLDALLRSAGFMPATLLGVPTNLIRAMLMQDIERGTEAQRVLDLMNQRGELATAVVGG